MSCKKRKKRHTGRGTAVGAMCPIVPNALWAMDFQFDVTVDGRTLKLLNVVDEYTRECPAVVADRSIDADRVVATLDALALVRGYPAFVRLDNGPEFVSNAIAGWCRFNDIDTIFIDPGSRWQNAWIESFNSRLRDEFLNSWTFDSLLEAQVLIEDSRIDYNTNRAHSAHGGLTPPSSPRFGSPETNQHSHSAWTSHRGPLRDLSPFEHDYFGRMTSGFAPGVAEKLRFYVYLLIDPRDDAIFYVGKGIDNRCFSHIVAARKTSRDTVEEFPKLERIRAIESSGSDVRIEILRYGLDEPTAFHVESAVIDLVPGLTNAVKGHHSDRCGVEHLNGLLGATPVVIAPEHRVILIRIAREYRSDITADELYNKTRKWWRVDKRWTDLANLKAPEYAFSVAGGVVRAVYKITAWEEAREAAIAEDGRRRGRRAFTGYRDAEMEEKYLWADVTAYLAQGAQNPIRYAHCAGHTPSQP